ncbi:MAG: 50S ribosomal protein L10 [Elusimicrobiales bacterium]
MAIITRVKKIELSKKLVDDVIQSDLIFISFEGLTFDKIQSLRNSLKKSSADFRIIRNSVMFFAVKEAGLLKDEKKPSFLKGPTAAIFIKNQDEISSICKVLVEFVKENQNVRIKGGFVSKYEITPEFVKELSKLGSKKDMLFRIACSLYTFLLNIRNVVEAPIRDLMYVIDAVKTKMEKDGK